MITDTSPQPISFEIELERSDACAPPAVKQRLEEHQRSQLTLQMIQEKLDRAYERKVQVIQSQILQSRETSDRVGLTQERKSSQERALGQRKLTELGQKQATAEAKRHEQIIALQERARNHNVKVLQTRQRRDSQDRAREERTQGVIAQKLTEAEERQTQLLSSIQARAKTHNEMAVARVQAFQKSEQESLDTKKFQIEEKLTRAATKRSDPSEKARAYNAKVQERIESIVSGKQEAADTRKARIEAKLIEAATRREDLITQVKAAAAQSAAPRAAASQSPSKKQAAEEEHH